MKDIKIIDNFLNEKEYSFILENLISKNFPWYISDMSDYPDDKNTQLYHIFYNNNIPYSDYFCKLQSIYDKLKIFSLYKVRLIATMKFDGKNNLFHTDIENIKSKELDIKTAIYYINTTDGGTEFEHNNKIVESVSNRMVVFPYHLKHRTVKHKTGDDFRYVLNLNYIEQ
jgi:hypothetical protein